MSDLKKCFINSTINNPMFARFVSFLEIIEDQKSDILRVLTYHRVDTLENRPYLYPGLSISPANFIAQMEYLATSGYQIISGLDLINRLTNINPEPLPPYSVLITFDDAYQDFQEYAWPVLKRYNFTAIMFVPTAFPGHPKRHFWWDTLYYMLTTTKKHVLYSEIGNFALITPKQQNATYKQLRTFLVKLPHAELLLAVEKIAVTLEVSPVSNAVLPWNDLRNLVADGLFLGAHTKNHPLLNRITPQESEGEINASIQELKENIGLSSSNLGGVLPIFAYPGGAVTPEVVSILEKAGIKAAFTSQRGIYDINQIHPLCIKRINIGKRTNLPVFRAQLLHRPAKIMSSYY